MSAVDDSCPVTTVTQSGGSRSCSRNRSRTCGRTSWFWRDDIKKRKKNIHLNVKYSQFQLWSRAHCSMTRTTCVGSMYLTNMSVSNELTISTNFSRKGTSFNSSLSFLSMNQLSIGMPLESQGERGGFNHHDNKLLFLKYQPSAANISVHVYKHFPPIYMHYSPNNKTHQYTLYITA